METLSPVACFRTAMISEAREREREKKTNTECTKPPVS